MAGTQKDHYVTGKKDSVKTVASNKPTKEEMRANYEKAKKEGKIKSGEIITPAKAGKAIAEVAGKITKAVSRTEEIAKNSVKVKESDNILRARHNVDSYYKTVKAKSGATAKEKAVEVTKTNKKMSPYKEPEVIRVQSDYVKPYKITGGAGSTARRAAEKAKKVKGD